MSQSDSPSDFFENYLPRQFEKHLQNVDLKGMAISQSGVVIQVVGAGQWTVSIQDTRLRIATEPQAQCALQLTVAEADFMAFFAKFSGQLEQADPQSLMRSEQLTKRLARWDEETTRLVRAVPGSILLKVDDDGTPRAIAITPGSQKPSLQSGACTVACRLSDLQALHSGATNPLGLLAEGKLRVTGDAQIAMGLAGIFL